MDSALTCGCGAVLPSGATWCPRCLEPSRVNPSAVTGHRAFGSVPPPGPLPGAGVGPAFELPAPKPGRFAKTEVSFGLTGRVALTILLLLPLAVFVYLAKEMIGIGGLVIYGGVILPWALRDLWRHPGRG